MDRERFSRLQALFAEVCDAPIERRRETVAWLRSEEPALADALERMLEHDSGSKEGCFEALRDELGHLAVTALPQVEPPLPATIAGFRIVGRLGSGGMGTVYRAEQQTPRRPVALKVLRPGATSSGALRRFELEAELLGRLQHPGIAQVFSAGTTLLDGHAQPWFAMELIEGEPLTRFVRDRELPIRVRLELLVKVALAVQHAHQKGVIHRDLKPANILVTANGEPKILDFGVARVIAPETVAPNLLTQVGQVLGTLPYMSPEQVAGATDVIDTRTDIYALGVIAYELLCGRLPHELVGKTIPEAARIVAEVDPPRLGLIDRTLRGDLETIVAKALERDPALRYASAQEFAADLTHHLQDEPIAARPPSLVDAMRKYVRRHRGLVAGSGIAGFVLMAAIIALTIVRVQKQRKQWIADSVFTVLDWILGAADPWVSDLADPKDARLLEVLAGAETKFEASFEGLPEVEAEARGRLGHTYASLGDLERARRHLVRAFALYQELEGLDSRPALHCLADLAGVALRSGNYGEAERQARDAVAGLRRVAGEGDPQTLRTCGVLINALRMRDRLDEAHSLAQETYATACRSLGENDDATLGALHNLGSMLFSMGRFEEAEAKLREASEKRSARYGPDHPHTLQSLGNLGEVLMRRGRLEEAETITRQVYEAHRRLLGDEHATTLSDQHGLAILVERRGRNDEALALLDELLDLAGRRLGKEHPLTLGWTYSRAILLHQMLRLPEAETSCRALLKAERRAYPEGVVDTLNLLATLLVDQKRPEEALPIFEEIVDSAAATLPADHWRSAIYRGNYGNCLRLLHRFEEAESELADSLEILEKGLGPEKDDTQYVLGKLILLYRDMGETGRAAELRQRLTLAGRKHAQ